VSNGRYDSKIKPLGFDTAASVLTCDFSPEAAENFTQMVRDVAREKDYSDAAALKTLKTRLNQAAKGRNVTRRRWANEVLEKLPRRRSLYMEGAVI
jgi:hypothetical protein